MNPDILMFFDRKPAALPLYEKFENRVLEEIKDVHVKVQKTQITFSNRHGFAFVSFLPVRKAKDRPEPYLTATFGLSHRMDSPRIDAAVEPYPNRWTHHVMIGEPEEIDEELMAWVAEAAEFAAVKQKVREKETAGIRKLPGAGNCRNQEAARSRKRQNGRNGEIITMVQKREFFLKTERTGFSVWSPDDLGLAELLWGDPEVTRYICASGKFSAEEIRKRLETERENGRQFHVQYWPVFELRTGELVGCCGLRPHGICGENGGESSIKEYEIGFHLRPGFWGQGYAAECAGAVIRYAFDTLGAEKLFAGHNPNNVRSKRVLAKLGFRYTGDEFYEPTGLYHPSYELRR